MQCPVCPNPDVGSGQEVCGTCGADLSSIRLLQELPARWFNEALGLIAAGSHAVAIGKLEAALAAGGNEPAIRRVLGKVLWNEGRTDEAREQWRLIPDDEEAKLLAAMRSPSRRMRGPLVVAATGLLGVLVGAGIAILVRGTGGAPVAPERLTVASAVPAAADFDGPAAPRHGLAILAASLSRITASISSEELEIRFEEGLFPSASSEPTAEGATVLQELGRILQTHPGPLTAKVIGYTDSMSPPADRWKDNWSLAHARARVAVDLMAREAGSGVSWSVESSGDRNTPFSNDTEADRARNRTVIVRVSEK